MQSELADTGGGGTTTPTRSWSSAAATAGHAVRAADRWREIRTMSGGGVRAALPDGRTVLQFASNDYLGLSRHPAVCEAVAREAAESGAGSGASRLIVGSRPVHDRLESALAEWKHTESALLFATGYAANVGVLGSLARLGDAAGEPVAIVSDELNHASIIDGARLARVPVSVYAHGDVDAASAAVGTNRRNGRRSVIVTDSVFSMDGDIAPLAALADLSSATGSLLVVDDAHAVFGGHGADALSGVDPTGSGAELLVVGTLSKTLGSLGGFVAGPTPLIEWFRNTARSFIFSTASPPTVMAAAAAALTIVRSAEGEALTARLRANVDRIAPGHPSAVVPVVLGDERRALDVSAALLDAGLLVPAIRPPTVAPGASRLRIALSADHTAADVDQLLEELARLGVPLGGHAAEVPA